MSKKRFTSEDFHIAAQQVCDELYTNPFADMLRQAADAEEENAKLRETINADSASMAGKDAVIEQLKARLEAVVKMLEEKECATSCSDCGHYNSYPCADHDECGLFKRHEEFTAILRAARGEGGAE